MMQTIKKYNRIIVFILIPIVFIILLVLYNNSRLIMINLPKGNYIKSIESNNGQYKLNAYIYNGAVMMDDYSVRVELENNKTHKIKNIYYKYHESKIKMKWIDDNIVEINKKRIDIRKDFYYKN